MADDDFIPCYIKELPERLQPRAAEVAARIYPLNAPAVPPPAEGIAEPARLALVNAKYWGKEPRTLTVSFLEDYPPEVKERILRHMNAWDCCVKFQLVRRARAWGPSQPALFCVASHSSEPRHTVAHSQKDQRL
jgi:hypothetical protein